MIEGITLEQHFYKDSNIICVLGCLLSQLGQKIKKEMLSWILPNFDTVVVNQIPPGKYYEFPALKMAQMLSLDSNKPILYLHTKGASNPNTFYKQENVRKIWENEFVNNYEFYNENLNINKPQLLLPFSNTNSPMTHFNGFIATPKAFELIDIPMSNDRYIYEQLFVNTKLECICRIYSDIIFDSTKWQHPTMEKLLHYVNTFKYDTK